MKIKPHVLQKYGLIFGALIIAIVVFIVYSPVTSHDFVSWDDGINVYENPHLNPVTSEGVCFFWKKPYKGLYIPLTYNLWAVQAIFSGHEIHQYTEELIPRSTLFHCVNLVGHIFNTILVCIILRMFVGNIFASCAGALIFALHPVQVESVAWVTEFKGILAGFFSLIAIWLYLLYVRSSIKLPLTVLCSGNILTGTQNVRSRENGDISGKTGRQSATAGSFRRVYYVLAISAFILALLSKPISVIVPLLLFALNILLLRRSWKRVIMDMLPFVIILIPFVFITRLIQHIEGEVFISSLYQRPFIAMDAIFFYLCKFLWPIGLVTDYGRNPRVVLENWWGYATWLVPVGLAVILWYNRKKIPFVLVGFALLCIGILPTSGIVPFVFQKYSTVADRYLYMSMLGPALVTAFIINFRPYICKISIGGFLIFFGIISYLQCGVWKDDYALWKHALTLNPHSWSANSNFGSYLCRAGEFEKALPYLHKSIETREHNPDAYYTLAQAQFELGELDIAIENIRKTVNLKPDFYAAYILMGHILLQYEKPEQAADYFQKALEINPLSLKAQCNIGVSLLRQEKPEQAETLFRMVLKRNPNSVIATYNLSMALKALGNVDEAIKTLLKVIELNPNFSEAYGGLGRFFTEKGEYEEAASAFQKHIELQPDDPEAYNNLGAALIMRGSSPEEVEPYFRKAVALNPDNFEHLRNLGNVLLQQEKWNEAIEVFERVIDLKPNYETALKTLEFCRSQLK